MPIVHGETSSKIRKRHPISLDTRSKKKQQQQQRGKWCSTSTNTPRTRERERGGGGATEVALAPPANQSRREVNCRKWRKVNVVVDDDSRVGTDLKK